MKRRRLQLLLLVSAGAVGFVAACADIFGIHSAEVDGGGTTDAATDAIEDVPFDYVLHDAIDTDVNTAVCGDGGVPFVATDAAVWVSDWLGTDSSNCGDQSTPCKTIGKAISLLGSRNVVYIDNSIFNESLVITRSGLTIQGGWMTDAGWVAVCDSNASVIQGLVDGGPAAIDVTTNGVTLRLMKVKSKQQGAQGQGESVYAVRAISAPNLAIDNVTLIAQNGGGGVAGQSQGASFACVFDGGGNGQDGSVGTAGASGTFDNNGYVPAQAGGGTSGSNGAVISSPQPGTCGPCNQGCP